jgi:hypothetical protein
MEKPLLPAAAAAAIPEIEPEVPVPEPVRELAATNIAAMVEANWVNPVHSTTAMKPLERVELNPLIV